MSSSATLVIFPVRNEARNLERLLGPLLDVVQQEGYHLLAIDDASTDASPEILHRHGVAAIRLVEKPRLWAPPADRLQVRARQRL